MSGLQVDSAFVGDFTRNKESSSSGLRGGARGLGVAGKPSGVDRSVTCLPLPVQSPRNEWSEREGVRREALTRGEPGAWENSALRALLF